MGPEVSALSRTLGEPHIYSGPLHVVWTSMYGIRVPPVPAALRAQDMHHPVCGLRRTSLPRTRVYKIALGSSWGLRLGRVIGIIAIREIPCLP